MNSVIRRKIGEVLLRLGYATAEQIEDALKTAQTESRRLGEILVERNIVSPQQLDQALQQQQENLLGLLDALDGEPLLSCIGATGTPNLDILPLGNANANHAAQLSPLASSAVSSPRLLRSTMTLSSSTPAPSSAARKACVAAAESTDGVVLTVSPAADSVLSRPSLAIAQLDAVARCVLGIVSNPAPSPRTISSSGFSSPISTALRPANGNPQSLPIRGGFTVKLGPVGRAVSANTAASSNSAR